MKLKFTVNKFLIKLFLVISFLLIYLSGDKISIFMLFYLIFSPLMVIDGSGGNIFSIDFNKTLVLIIDGLYIISLYFAIFYLVFSSIKKINTKTDNWLSLFSVIILWVPTLRINFNNTLTIITLSIFYLCSCLVIWMILKDLIKEHRKKLAGNDSNVN